MTGKSGIARRIFKSLALFILRSELHKAKQAEEKAHLEVERKFRLFDGEIDNLETRLPKCGFLPIGELTMTDTFLPALKDEDMIRIRVESEGELRRRILTLKDWVMIDGERERREQEGEIGLVASLVLRLVGRLVEGNPPLSFSKVRRSYSSSQPGAEHGSDVQVVVSVDQVKGLGVYSGAYLEVEIIVPVGGDVKSARERIRTEVFELLGENRDFVPRSYLDMLKEATV
ncbi:MAG: CYTH domain-containing protein [Candidatus Obscuribacterales bacterium]|nr:CYTH domain-containing protein [Candidatus Obscuribacterales bacterium]